MYTKTTKTDPWAKINQVLANEGAPQGDGWIDLRQFAAKFGLQPESGHVRRLARKLVARGLLEQFNSKDQYGRIYYRPKD